MDEYIEIINEIKIILFSFQNIGFRIMVKEL